MAFYSTKTKSRRWTMTAFSYVLDMARVNFSIVYYKNQERDKEKGDNKMDHKKLNSFQFLERLVREMVKPHIRERKRNGLQWLVVQKMQTYLGEKFEKEERKTSKNDKGERCHVCLTEIHGDGMKKSKEKLYKVKTFCTKCDKAVCKKHSNHICSDCIE